MKEQDKLKNTLRDFYDNQEAPYSENDWEQASAYLQAARRGRKKRYLVPILLMFISGSLLLLVYFPESKDSKYVQASVNSKPGVTSGASSATSPPSLEKSKRDLSAVSDLPEPEKTAKSQTSALLTKAQAPSTPESDFSEGHPDSQNTKVPGDGSQEQTAIRMVVTSTKVKTPAKGSKNETNFSEPKEITETKPVKPEDPATGQDLSPLQNKSQILTPALTQQKEVADLSDTQKETAGADTTSIVQAPRATTVTPDELRPKSVMLTSPNEELVNPDSLPEVFVNQPFVRDAVFYELGGAAYYGWKSPEGRDARGFSPVVGIHYLNRLSSRSAFSFGIQYLQVSNLSNSSKTSRVSTYVYGEQSNVTVITPSTLHYLVAPLRFQYYINRKNSVGIGMNVAYLMNVDARVTTYDEKPGFTGNYKTIKQGRYMDGFSWYDSQLAFCYRRRIFNSLAAQAEVFIGLTDVKQDDFFALKQKEKNSGIKLSLLYYVFRKKGNE